MEYKTRDFYQAAALKTCHIPLLRLESSPDEKYFFFVFEDSGDGSIKETSATFREGTLFVNAVDFVLSIKELKQKVFAMKDTQKHAIPS